MIADQGYKGFYIDLWSLGVLLYAMLQGRVPYKANSLQDLHALILKGHLRFPVSVSNDAKHLIDSLLVVQPEKRISISQILRHPWLKDAIDGIEGTEEDDMHDFAVG